MCLRSKADCRVVHDDEIGSLLHDQESNAVCRGRNLEGQCGQADTPVVAEPTEVEGLTGLAVRNVQGGRAHAAAVLETGEVLTWGCGHSGKLGHGGGGSSPTPTRCSYLLASHLCSSSTGQYASWGKVGNK